MIILSTKLFNNLDILPANINILSIAKASFIQINILYPIKTAIKSQYIYNKSISNTFKDLLFNKDKLRIYRGIIPNISKSTIGRVSDLSLYSIIDKNLENNSIITNSFTSSSISTLLKTIIMPLDVYGNIYQVHGKDGKQIIKNNLNSNKLNNIKFLYRGTLAYGLLSYLSTSLWLSSYNILDTKIEKYNNEKQNICRNALIGFSANILSDILVNPIRIIKTYKQSHKNNITYFKIIKNIKNNPLINYGTRGLLLRIFMNSLNNSIFIVLWKLF